MELAAHNALSHWGIVSAKLELIKYRENAVFRVEHKGSVYALRVHRLGYHNDPELHSEIEWMQALGRAGISVPEIVYTNKLEPFVREQVNRMPGKVQIDLFEWINGKPLGSVEQGISEANTITHTYATIGKLAAQVHNQSAAWQPSKEFTRHAWDADGLAGDEPFWGRFWELPQATMAQRALLLRSKNRLFRDLSTLPCGADTYSMIHADFVPENLMVDEGSIRLIDFDDAGFGWHLFELATALYFIRDQPYYPQAKKALIAGYRLHRPLSDEQLNKLPLFFLARGVSYIGWVFTRQETETAREMTPYLLELVCDLANEYMTT